MALIPNFAASIDVGGSAGPIRATSPIPFLPLSWPLPSRPSMRRINKRNDNPSTDDTSRPHSAILRACWLVG